MKGGGLGSQSLIGSRLPGRPLPKKAVRYLLSIALAGRLFDLSWHERACIPDWYLPIIVYHGGLHLPALSIDGLCVVSRPPHDFFREGRSGRAVNLDTIGQCVGLDSGILRPGPRGSKWAIGSISLLTNRSSLASLSPERAFRHKSHCR